MDMAKLEYVEAGDYLIPALTLGEEQRKPLGKYGLMRFRHLKENDKVRYTILELKGQLDSHLAETDETAALRVEGFIEEMLKTNPAPDRTTDPMAWVGHMENLKARAEEIVTRELIFTPPERMRYLQETIQEPEELMNMPF
jgi:hypothetical protein